MNDYYPKEQIQQDTSDAAMTRAVEESLLDTPRQIARLLGTEIHDAPDLFWATSGVPLGMSNGVYRSILTSENADATIVVVQEEFRRRHLPLMWQVTPSSRPLDLRQRLLAHGFVHSEDEPGMALDILAMNQDFPVPAELEIRIADDLPLVHEWIATWGFGIPGDKLALFQDVYRRLGVGPDRPWRYYLGFFQGRPVATTQLVFAAGVAAIHDVATFPEMRNKGIGTAMTLAALRDARRMGYRIAILTASPYGERIYRRIGFRDYGTISRYDWQAEKM